MNEKHFRTFPRRCFSVFFARKQKYSLPLRKIELMKRYILPLLASGMCLTATAGNDIINLLVGTYTNTGSKGIYSLSFDQTSGESMLLDVAETDNPSFLTLSPDKRTLYAVNESGKPTDAVTAFSFDKKSGKLKEINRETVNGTAPCYVATNGKYVLTANYGSGSITVLPTGSNGKLLPAVQTEQFTLTGKAPDKARQNGPHLHCVKFSPDSTFFVSADLGNDLLYVYTFTDNPKKPIQQVESVQLPAGSGPRHITFSDDGRYAYLLTELSGKIFVFEVNGTHLKEVQTIECDKVGARGSADIHLSPDGNYLYASNRLRNEGIAIYKVNRENGTVSPIAYRNTAAHPRNFAITPNGKYLLCACRDTNVIQVFCINGNGTLSIKDTIDIPAPVCVLFNE